MRGTGGSGLAFHLSSPEMIGASAQTFIDYYGREATERFIEALLALVRPAPIEPEQPEDEEPEDTLHFN